MSRSGTLTAGRIINSDGNGVVDNLGDRVELKSGSGYGAAMADDGRGFYGIQFHPEVTHTAQGRRILERFVHDICGCEEEWTPENIIRDSIERVREQLGLNENLLTQYAVYMRDMLTGDWGTSLTTKQPVLDSIMGRAPASLELIVACVGLVILRRARLQRTASRSFAAAPAAR